MESNNFTLLSQDEIDALVSFLTEKDVAVDSGVLSQESIDRLVSLLSSADRNLFGKEVVSDNVEAVVDKDVIKGLEMLCNIKEDTVLLSIYVVCNGEKIELNPMCLEYGEVVESASVWGKAIVPAMFCRISALFELEYTKETYKRVVERFAEVMYGDKDAGIASVYLPNADNLIEHIS